MVNTEVARLRMRALAVVSRIGPAWTLTLIVTCVDAAWLALGGWSVPWSTVGVIAAAVALFFAPLANRRYRNDPRIGTTLRSAALLVAFWITGATLSYLVVSTNAPLVDASLAAWDHALGFDWLALHAWLQTHPSARAALHLAYYSGLAQLVLVVLLLGFGARPARLEEFMRLFIVACLVTTVLSGFFPAAGAWKHYELGKSFDLSLLSHFELLRNGQLREIPLGRLQGLVAIPSLHSAMAVLLIYVMRGTLVHPIFVTLNTAMLVSTPINGGHYLVDVLAGVALALGLITLERQRGGRSLNAAVTVSTAGRGSLRAIRQ